MSRKYWIAVLTVALVTILIGVTDKADSATTADSATKAESARICVNGKHDWQRPQRMGERFKDGDYCTASGTNLPDWVFRQAKEYALNHPGIWPRARGIDWSWLSWLNRPLTTGRCLGWYMIPASWVGCDSQPDWVRVTRQVEIWCSGALVIVAATTRNPVAILAGGAACAWAKLESEYGTSWRQVVQ